MQSAQRLFHEKTKQAAKTLLEKIERNLHPLPDPFSLDCHLANPVEHHQKTATTDASRTPEEILHHKVMSNARKHPPLCQLNLVQMQPLSPCSSSAAHTHIRTSCFLLAATMTNQMSLCLTSTVQNTLSMAMPALCHQLSNLPCVKSMSAKQR